MGSEESIPTSASRRLPFEFLFVDTVLDDYWRAYC